MSIKWRDPLPDDYKTPVYFPALTDVRDDSERYAHDQMRYGWHIFWAGVRGWLKLKLTLKKE